MSRDPVHEKETTNLMVDLLCTVRSCGERLERKEGVLLCATGHSFDIAQTGYVNLLQPQDRRSRSPGDSRETVSARRRFLESGNEDFVVEALAPLIAELLDGPDKSVLDVGCGEGFHLKCLSKQLGFVSHGLDISVPAIRLAATVSRDASWVVANADRFLPYASGSFQVVMSITARRNASEFSRVLDKNGSLVVIVPAADDLIELRNIASGNATERDRASSVLESFSGLFELRSRQTIKNRVLLDRETIDLLLALTYRGVRLSEQTRMRDVTSVYTTMSRDIFTFRPLG